LAVSLIIYYGILFLGVLTGAFKFKRLLKPGRFLLTLVLYVFIKEFSAFLINKTFGYSLDYYKYLSSIDFILTMIVFLNIPILKSKQTLLLIILLAGIGFYFLNIFIWQPPGKGIDSYFKIGKSFLLIICALVLLFCLTKYINQQNPLKSSEFWFSSGTLIFYTVSMFYWGIFNYNLANKQAIMKQILRPLFEYSNYILYGCITFSLWMNNFINSEKKGSQHNVEG
jgi:hypothetical protein